MKNNKVTDIFTYIQNKPFKYKKLTISNRLTENERENIYIYLENLINYQRMFKTNNEIQEIIYLDIGEVNHYLIEDTSLIFADLPYLETVKCSKVIH